MPPDAERRQVWERFPEAASQAGFTQPAPLRIRQYPGALPAPLFRRLLRAVRAVGEEALTDSYRTNFWYARGAPPSNLAEEAIAQLWALVRPGAGCVGAEWWLGRLRAGEGLPLHFDRDLTLQKTAGRVVHPLWSSILYLNRFPASPTVVLDQVLGHDGRLLPARASAGKAIEPVPNRYLVYPGNLYHGVMANGAKRRARLRLTLLVNYWDRRPLPPVCRDYDGSVYRALRRARARS